MQAIVSFSATKVVDETKGRDVGRMLGVSNSLETSVFAQVRRAVTITLCAALLPFSAVSIAHAQDSKTETSSRSAPLPSTAPTPQTRSSGLMMNLSSSFDQRFDSVSVPRLDLPDTVVGSTLFKLDLSETACLSFSENCDGSSDQRLGLGVSKSIMSNSKDGIDLILRPSASLRFDENSSSAIVGAVVEIGENLREGSDFKSNTWYLFAGADAEALTYSPDGFANLSGGNFHLQDRIIVGDAQAGLGYRIGDADVSLSYSRREAQAEDFSYTEDAAALSFTWKR